MIKEITLVRHGLCTGNIADRASSKGDHSYFTDDIRNIHSDLWPLVPEGIEQSQNAGMKIRESIAESFDYYFDSGILRARQTSVHLGFGKKIWRTDTLLRERNWGGFENIPYDERNKLFDESSTAKTEDSVHWKTPGGEPMTSIIQRLEFFLHRISLMHACKRILVVTHGGPFQAMRVIQNRIHESEYVDFIGGDNYIRNCQIAHYSNCSDRKFKLEQMFYMTNSGDWKESAVALKDR